MGIEINTNENKKTMGEYAIDFIKAGNGAAIPKVNGVELPCMVGYVSESDKQACIKVIQKAVKATGGDPYATARYIQNAMLTAASGIRPDEEVEVEGVKMLVSYTDKAIYDGTIQIANMEDLSTVDDKDAIKAILMERAKNNLPLLMEPDYYEDSYGNYDYYDEKIVPNRPIEDITKEANKLTDEELRWLIR